MSIKNLLSRFVNWVGHKESKVERFYATVGPGGVVWTPRNYESFSKEAYLKNAVAFRCIDEISKSVASVDWEQIQKLRDGTHEPTDEQPHWLNRANPNESFAFLLLKATAFLALAGNSYLERNAPSGGRNQGEIRELYVQRPDRMQVLIWDIGPLQGQVRGFRYELNGQQYDFEVDH